MLAAMDGQENIAANGSTARREDPTAFFFIIFGLIYEALANSTADSTLATSSRQSGVIAGLQALKCLVRPEYSGKVLFEPVTFEEFISLCYRMTMTEPAAVIVHLIPMVAALVASAPPSAEE